MLSLARPEVARRIELLELLERFFNQLVKIVA
jgi:hypothetical protein